MYSSPSVYDLYGLELREQEQPKRSALPSFAFHNCFIQNL